MPFISSFISWDQAAIYLALIAVLLRLADRPRAATISSSLSVLAAAIGQRLAHRAIRPGNGPGVAPLPSSGTTTGD